MITENLSTLKIHKLSQAQYDRAVENGTIDENALYLTPDEDYADYVVEQGESSIWTYRKGNSGLAECWCTKIYNENPCTEPYGGLYITTEGESVGYPFAFAERPQVTFSVYGGIGFCFGIATNLGSQSGTPVFRFVSNHNGDTGMSYSVNAVGKWK